MVDRGRSPLADPSLRRCTIISVSPDFFVTLRVPSCFARSSSPGTTFHFLWSSFLLTLRAPPTATGYPLTHEFCGKGGDSLALVRTNMGNDRMGEVRQGVGSGLKTWLGGQHTVVVIGREIFLLL